MATPDCQIGLVEQAEAKISQRRGSRMVIKRRRLVKPRNPKARKDERQGDEVGKPEIFRINPGGTKQRPAKGRIDPTLPATGIDAKYGNRNGECGKLNCRMKPANRRAAIPATPAQQRKTCQRHKIERAELVPAMVAS